MVHLDRRLWHLVHAGYLWERYGRAVFIAEPVCIVVSLALREAVPDGLRDA